LADSQDAVSKNYSRPTQGVRIVEFESNKLELEGERVNIVCDLELSSGADLLYGENFQVKENSYLSKLKLCRISKPDCELKAFKYRYFILNTVQNFQTNTPFLSHHNRYDEFALKTGIRPRNLLILLHHTNERTNDSAIAAFRLPPEMTGISVFPSNIDKEGEVFFATSSPVSSK
jgi:hypothetical protein